MAEIPSDEALVVLAKDGDREAFGRLVRLHEGTLYALCRRLAKDTPAADDLAIEAFTEAFVKIGDLRDPAKFGAWLCRIALNLFRSGSRKRKREDDALQSARAEAVPSEGRPSLDEALAAVSAEHQEVLILHYWERLSCEEIADSLGLPTGTVLSRLHRARRALRDRIDSTTVAGEETMNASTLARDVQMELDLLGRIESRVDEASERLSLILSRNPEKFAFLIRLVDSAEERRHLGALIRRIRTPVMETVLSCWFSTDSDLRQRTGRVLDAWITHLENNPRRDFYAFLDLLLSRDLDDGQRTDLLAHLVSLPQRLGSQHHCPWIFIDVTAAFPDAAMALLFPRFLTQAPVDGKHISHGVPAALWKIPTRFCEPLLEYVTGEDEDLRERAQTGFRRAAGNLDPDRDAGTVNRLIGRLDQMWDRGDSRQILLGLYFALKGFDSTKRLRELYAEADEALRRRIAGQLLKRGDEAVLPDVIASARSEDPEIRKESIAFLGSCGVTSAKDVFREAMADPVQAVRLSAITAFGKVADRFDETLLHDLMRSGDKTVARTAARAIRKKPREQTGLERARIERIRGDADPEYHMSPIDAVAALPEVREYHEKELSGIIAGICTDWATTRRHLVMGFGTNDRLMTRENSVYELTELGESVWRVGQLLKSRGVKRTAIGKWKNE